VIISGFSLDIPAVIPYTIRASRVQYKILHLIQSYKIDFELVLDKTLKMPYNSEAVVIQPDIIEIRQSHRKVIVLFRVPPAL
jgi:hypothetical protein